VYQNISLGRNATNGAMHCIIPLMAKTGKNKTEDTSIVVNKKASHDYYIGDRLEAGIALSGWEVKSLREKKVQLADCHVIIKNGEAWLLGAKIDPLNTASTHVIADPTRTRKLLLHKKELAKIFAGIQQKGSTCVCTKLYWKNHLVKCQIALAKGKQSFDKRATIKEREWSIDKQRTVRHSNR
jgi:SsrA-binding protein